MARKVAVTGGAGYVGSALVPALERDGFDVTVIDLFLYGEKVLDGTRCRRVKADIRDAGMLEREFRGMDAVVHLACISNDPSFELDPALGKSVNYDAFAGLVAAAKAAGVRRFVYASSSSVYGVREEPNVREESPCTPLTDYSKFKLMCEKVLAESDLPEWVVVRPATVCGYAPRLRLDVVVNMLTLHALAKKSITVFGGDQLRPNLNVLDMVDVYRLLLEAPREKVHRGVFNAGYENLTVRAIAERIKSVVGDPEVTIRVEPTDDNRSYHVNSDRIKRVLGFSARRTVDDAIRSLAEAYRAGRIPDPLTNPVYSNIKTMQKAKLA